LNLKLHSLPLFLRWSYRCIPDKNCPPPLADESYCAREPVVAYDDISFYSLVGAFHIHRQPERQERRARQLYTYDLAAVGFDEAPGPGERYELGCYFGRFLWNGRGGRLRLAIERSAPAFSPARPVIYILNYGLLFLNPLFV
jgi:hypothetical protein